MGVATVCNEDTNSIIWVYALTENITADMGSFREDIFSKSCVTISGFRIIVAVPSTVEREVTIPYSIVGYYSTPSTTAKP